ncbi:MAG: hypothetical protein ACHQNA_06115, partial [Acidimicrobiales bacterium]
PELAATVALAASGGLGSPDATHCPNCGAPYTHAQGGRCPFCKQPLARASLEVSAPDLAEQETEARAAARQSSGLVEAAVDAEINGL